MVSDWTKLYNTMRLVKTEGDSTEIMADCLRFVKIKMAEEQQVTPADEGGES